MRYTSCKTTALFFGTTQWDKRAGLGGATSLVAGGANMLVGGES